MRATLAFNELIASFWCHYCKLSTVSSDVLVFLWLLTSRWYRLGRPFSYFARNYTLTRDNIGPNLFLTNSLRNYTLLTLITPALNGVISYFMALKGPVFYVCLREFDHEHLKNKANKGRRWRDRRSLRAGVIKANKVVRNELRDSTKNYINVTWFSSYPANNYLQ